MTAESPRARLREFVDRFGGATIKSTGAFRVSFADVLYNVDGSSDDPEIDGQSWKGLLLSHGIDGPCYVTNPTPDGNSHPNFSVGGHMTPNPDGRVAVGEDSYLMPLCFWHNSKARDGVAFTHTRTEMLRLTGFMQSEMAATFMARMPSVERVAIVFESAQTLATSNLSETQADAIVNNAAPEEVLNQPVGDYVILTRGGEDPSSDYAVTATSSL